jgi:dihydrofolate reductase (trimethoprim resistance protein)
MDVRGKAGDWLISLIAAMAENRVIGNQGKIPWKIPGEQKRFRELTLGKTIIMGRKTLEEIGKPLPERKTILISRTWFLETAECTTVSSWKEALQQINPDEEVFVAGGSQVYQAALPDADRIYLTVIHQQVEGDTYFPQFSEEFQKIEEKNQDGEIPYTYYIYERKRDIDEKYNIR